VSKGKIPESITNRSKQAYRAPIATSFYNSNSPDYVKDILSENTLKDYGIFNPLKVESLITKIKNNIGISEIDQMAIAGILSTQLLYKLFVVNKIIPNVNNVSNLRVIRDI